MIHVVGGVYKELCTRPSWNALYGSAGRAAVAVARMGCDVRLHSYFTQARLEEFQGDFAWHANLSIEPTIEAATVRFRYLHDSAVPFIDGVPPEPYQSLTVKGNSVIRFGMLEGDAKVEAEWAVYDPQNMGTATSFGANGSSAKHLALVLNRWEARAMAGMPDGTPEQCAPALAKQEGAEVVVIKLGPRGALVWHAGRPETVPAYRTSNVWKIGSGDCFVAHFAHAWMVQHRAPVEAAETASRATAFYCQTKALPTEPELKEFAPSQVKISDEYRSGVQRQVYLAGPFFDLAQIWMIEECRRNLREMGLKVLSPFHDIGLGSAKDVVQQDLDAIVQSNLVFAIADGLDSGTLYEIGFARAHGKPAILYSERESAESLKMAEGSGCVVCSNYTTALYACLWEAAAL